MKTLPQTPTTLVPSWEPGFPAGCPWVDGAAGIEPCEICMPSFGPNRYPMIVTVLPGTDIPSATVLDSPFRWMARRFIAR